MNRAAYAVLWLLVFSTAWEEVVAVPGFGRISRVIGMVALAAGVLGVLLAGRLRHLHPLHGLVALFVCWSAASIFWTINPESTFRQSFTYLQLALLVWLIWELAPTERRRHGLLQAYVLGAYLSAGYTIASAVLSPETTTRFAAAGYNPNDLGFTLVLAFPMAWYLTLAGRSGAALWVNRLYLPVGVTAVLLTASRGALISALAALLFVPWSLPRLAPRAKATLAALLVATVYALDAIVPAASLERLGTTTEEIRGGSFSSRGEIWSAGWEIFLRHPIVGTGAGTFAEAVVPVLGYPRSPHQSFLSIMVGQGIIGLVLFLAMFAPGMLAIPAMPPPQRKFWTVLLLTLLIGLLPRTWDYRKPTWLILGVLSTQAAVAAVPIRVRRGGAEAHPRPLPSRG